MTSSTALSDTRVVPYDPDERGKTDFGLHDAPGAGKPSNPPSSAKSQFESDDDYHRVVCVLDTRTRVIECSDGIQWAIQRRGKAARSWQSEFYFRSRVGLLLYAPKPTAPELLELPDWFPERVAF